MLVEYKKIFDELNARQIYHFGSYISSSQYIRAYNLVRKYLKDGSLILDWGCGSGHFSYFLLNMDYDVSAFTIEDECYLSEHLYESFADRYSIIKGQNPLANLPYDDCSFDSVVSIGVLEHVRETGNTEINSLNEIKRVLKPGGHFICYHFPNKYSWIESIAKVMGKQYHHNFKYNKRNVNKLVEQSGLQLVEFKRYAFLPRNIFRNFPNRIFLADIFNFLDRVLSIVFNIFCQNNYFVARKSD